MQVLVFMGGGAKLEHKTTFRAVEVESFNVLLRVLQCHSFWFEPRPGHTRQGKTSKDYAEESPKGKIIVWINGSGLVFKSLNLATFLWEEGWLRVVDSWCFVPKTLKLAYSFWNQCTISTILNCVPLPRTRLTFQLIKIIAKAWVKVSTITFPTAKN